MRRRIDVALDWPFLGTEALARGAVNRYQLRTRYDAVFRNVYVPKGQALSAADKALAAWLWSGRRATVAGLSAVHCWVRGGSTRNDRLNSIN